MLTFDDATARFLDDAYRGSDVTRRRLANLAALGPRPGDRVADIGAGTGLLALDLSRAVGPGGRVFCVEPSASMRATAAETCAGRDNVDVLDGRAEALPIAAASLDGAVALQVYEYLPDMPAALAEAHRVLRPGGRLVIGGWHWDSQIWHSDDPERMARILAIWDGHLAERCTPALLPPLMRAAGFGVRSISPVLFHDDTGRSDGIARMFLHLIAAYAVKSGKVIKDEVADWVAEQERMADEGRFFFALTHYVIAAERE